MWDEFLMKEKKKNYYNELMLRLDYEYSNFTVYPKREDLFNAFKCKDVKVVILGQDPYHNPNQAHGLAFSVNDHIKTPPSLRNIFKELADDIGHNIPMSGNLSKWVDEGVLLLNTTLSVRKNQPNSHKNIGWMTFTDNVIKYLSDRNDSIVFILWGNNARSKKKLIDERHLVIESSHPSPLSASRGFFQSKPFSRANEFLINNGKESVEWCLENIDLFSLK
ncbi:uracil-DNA glycosylase [Mycoplasmatota bacterium]|nr:uracil-DNA glycosylase [Mycoplasmatota bacterium]